MDMRFGTCDARSLYSAGWLTAIVREIAKYKLDLEGLQKTRWDRSRTEPAGDYILFYGKGNEIRELETGFFWTQENHIMACRSVAKRRLCKRRPLIGNVSSIHVRNNRKTGYATRF
jgi:hypothetical protein